MTLQKNCYQIAIFFLFKHFFLFLGTCVFYCWILQRICALFFAVVFCLFCYLWSSRLAFLGVNKSQIIFSHKKCHISWCIQFQFHCQFFSHLGFLSFTIISFFPFWLLCKDPTLNLSSRNGALHNFLLNLMVVRMYFNRQPLDLGIMWIQFNYENWLSIISINFDTYQNV